MCCRILFANILFRIFHQYSYARLVCSFILCSLSGLKINIRMASQKNLEGSLLSLRCPGMKGHRNNPFVKDLKEFTHGTISAQGFLEEWLYLQFLLWHQFHSNNLSIWDQCVHLWFLRKIFNFIKNFKFICPAVSTLFSYFLLFSIFLCLFYCIWYSYFYLGICTFKDLFAWLAHLSFKKKLFVVVKFLNLFFLPICFQIHYFLFLSFVLLLTASAYLTFLALIFFLLL